jgi:chloramphenicol O-acetyltransferase
MMFFRVHHSKVDLVRVNALFVTLDEKLENKMWQAFGGGLKN